MTSCEGWRVRCQVPGGAARALLAGFLPADSADLLVGLDPADDAAVYRLDDERAIVFTVDFFPPRRRRPSGVRRDRRDERAQRRLRDGRYAAARALGRGVPRGAADRDARGRSSAGADEVVRAAGAILAGGHTIRDDEPKYGLAVVGTVHPDGIWPKSGAQPGDALFLTKPLGTGLVLQAEREGRARPGALDAAIAAMRTLNRDAAETLRPFGPNAVTDVTGFGLLGHAYEMASGAAS